MGPQDIKKMIVTGPATITPRLESFRLDFPAVEWGNDEQWVEVWSYDEKQIKNIYLHLGIGTPVEVFGGKYGEKIRVSLDHGGKFTVESENYQLNHKNDLTIRNIKNQFIANIQNPLLHYLADYPFRNMQMLRGLSNIGASCGGISAHHCEPGGLLNHIEEMLRLLISDQSTTNVNIEIAIVAVIWHDLGKIAIVDENNPRFLKNPPESAIDHERMGLVLLGKAIGESQFSIEAESDPIFRILCSTIGNVHNQKIYQNHVKLLRAIDGFSAGFSLNNSIGNGGFKEAITN